MVAVLAGHIEREVHVLKVLVLVDGDLAATVVDGDGPFLGIFNGLVDYADLSVGAGP